LLLHVRVSITMPRNQNKGSDEGPLDSEKAEMCVTETNLLSKVDASFSINRIYFKHTIENNLVEVKKLNATGDSTSRCAAGELQFRVRE